MICCAFTRFATLVFILTLCLTAPLRTAAAQTVPVAAMAAQDTTTLADSVAGSRDGAALAAKGYGWFGRSFIVGGLTNVFGAMVIIPVAVISEPSVPRKEREKIMAKSPEYQKAFERGYSRKAYPKRILTTIAGSLLGAATIGYAIQASGNGG